MRSFCVRAAVMPEERGKKEKREKIPVEFADGTCYSKTDSGAQSTPEAKRPKMLRSDTSLGL